MRRVDEPLPVPSTSWVIEPRGQSYAARAREVWTHRRLLRFFGNRTLLKLIRRTYLGWGWAFIRPLFPLTVQALIFGGVLGIGPDGVPYFLFLVVGTTGWQLFANSLMWATRSLELNRSLLARAYVPRLILPLAAMSPAFLYFFIYIGVAIGTVIYFAVVDGQMYVDVGPQLVWAGLATCLIVLFALGLALWTSVPALAARDVRFSLAYVLSFWFFLTPVLYPASAIDERWRWLLSLNPMATLVLMFKFGVLGIGSVVLTDVAVAVGIIVITVSSGLWFFSRAEAEAADKV